MLNEVREDKPSAASSLNEIGSVQNVRNLDDVVHPLSLTDINRLKRSGTIASIFSVVIGLVTWVIWPLPLYRDYIFTRSVSTLHYSHQVIWRKFIANHFT